MFEDGRVVTHGCRHRGRLWGLKIPQIFRLYIILYLLGTIVDLYQVLAFISLKTSKIVILHNQIDENFSSKVLLLITGQKNFAHFNCVQWPPPTPHITNCVYSHVTWEGERILWNQKNWTLNALADIKFGPMNILPLVVKPILKEESYTYNWRIILISLIRKQALAPEISSLMPL